MVTTIFTMVAFSIITIIHSDVVPESDDRIVSAAVVLTGAGSAEELGEDELERFRSLAATPLVLSRASRSRLLSSGLFSTYQVAALWDYRQRHGDVFSFAELATVNGFSAEYVEALRPFVSLDPASNSGPVGASSIRDSTSLSDFFRYKVKGEVMYRDNINVTGAQTSKGFDGNIVAGGALKANFAIDDSWEAGGGFKESSGFSPKGRKSKGEDWSFFASWAGIAGRKVSLTRAVIGDYNLRFGQGLAMWGGYSISGVPTPSSMSRNPTGLSPYRSYSGSSAQRGAAAEISCGHLSLTTAFSVPAIERDFRGCTVAANLLYFGLNHQESATFYTKLNERGLPTSMVASVDGRLNIRGYDLWGEVATNMSSAAMLLGTRGKVIDNLTLAMLIRFYPKEYSSDFSGALRSGSSCTDEHGATLALSYRGGSSISTNASSFPRCQHLLDASFDMCVHPSTNHTQVKSVVTYDCQPHEAWNLVTRFQFRQRNYDLPTRAELRADLTWMPSALKITGRLDGLLTMNAAPELSGLAFINVAWTSQRPALSLKARSGLYRTAGWPARIYVYESDCPGFYTVPAFYGEGWWASACCTYRPFDAIGNNIIRKLSLSASLSYRRKMDDSGTPSLIVHFAVQWKI